MFPAYADTIDAKAAFALADDNASRALRKGITTPMVWALPLCTARAISSTLAMACGGAGGGHATLQLSGDGWGVPRPLSHRS